MMVTEITQYPARICFAANWQNYEILLILNHLQFISLKFTFRCFCLNCAFGPAHVRRDCLSGKRASDRNAFQNARTYQSEGHTSLCQNHIQKSHGGHEGIKEQAEGLEAGIRYDET